LPAILETSSLSLQGIDHDSQAGVGGSRTVTGLTGDSDFGAQHGVIQVVERGMAALAARLEHLLLVQCGV
jgi:hypothetical protein